LFGLVKKNLHGWTVSKDTALRAGLARALGADK
jgi:ferrochelatase